MQKATEGEQKETSGCVPPLIILCVSSFCFLFSFFFFYIALPNLLAAAHTHRFFGRLSRHSMCRCVSSHRTTHLSATFRAVWRKRAWSFSFRLCSACVMRALERSRHCRQLAICCANLRSFITCNTHSHNNETVSF